MYWDSLGDQAVTSPELFSYLKFDPRLELAIPVNSITVDSIPPDFA